MSIDLSLLVYKAEEGGRCGIARLADVSSLSRAQASRFFMPSAPLQVDIVAEVVLRYSNFLSCPLFILVGGKVPRSQQVPIPDLKKDNRVYIWIAKGASIIC